MRQQETGVKPPSIDDLLREGLPDDLPAEVEARLDRRIDQVLAERRRPVARGRPTPGAIVAALFGPGGPTVAARRVAVSAAVPVALALLVAGAALQGLGVRRPSVSVPRLNAAVSLAWAIGSTEAPRCSLGGALGDLAPAALSARVYRDWALVREERSGSSAMRLLFRALDEPAFFEVEVDAGSFRPRRLRRLAESPSATPGAVVDTCEWPPTAGTAPEGRSR